MNIYKQFGQARLVPPHGFLLDETDLGGIHEVFVKCLCDWQTMHHFSPGTPEPEKFAALEQDVREHNASAGGVWGGL